ncbi:hypothetical protein TrCOL_g5703 [Triparma columacea]|nr:hypothetical protein TrCOL_g5703 [Triparma columacea]
MLLIFSDCFPSTVSELIQDTEAAHGMVFRSLMVMGGLCGLMTDFSQLSPSPAREITTTTAYLVGALHVLRRLMMAAAVGFCFAPASGRDHGVERIRDVKKGAEVDSKRLGIKIKALEGEKRAELGRTAIVGSIHVLLALAMLSTLPALEGIALVFDIYAIFPRLRLAIAGGHYCALAWACLSAVRILHVVAINIGLLLFSFHFCLGFFTARGGHSYKGFWAEFATCVNFANLMLLASVSAWFKDFEEFSTRDPYIQYAALSVAFLHAFSALVYCSKNLLLCLRNVEYSEKQLAKIFDKYKRDEFIFQTLMDAQLAFINHVQNSVEGDGGWGEKISTLATQLIIGFKVVMGFKR